MYLQKFNNLDANNKKCRYVTNPGATNGSKTIQSACIRFAPSIRAASSSSAGSERKKPINK